SWKGKDEVASLEDSIRITASNIGREQFELTISKALVVANDGHDVVASYWGERAEEGGVSTSEPLNLWVGAPRPVSRIDISTMQLGTDWEMFVYYNGTELFRPGEAPSGSYATRQGKGGVPPLTYRSSAPEIARVDQDSGLVESFGIGRATITVGRRVGPDG
ncbi:hypothetical protein ACLEJP_24855, partial [Pseudomonas sp. SMV7]